MPNMWQHDVGSSSNQLFRGGKATEEVAKKVKARQKQRDQDRNVDLKQWMNL